MTTSENRTSALPSRQVRAAGSSSLVVPGIQRTKPHSPSSLSERTSSTAQPTPPPAGRQPKLLDRLREALCSRHYSPPTEQTYSHWVKRYIFFHDDLYPCPQSGPRGRSESHGRLVSRARGGILCRSV